jgi:hypothetical protein
MLTITTSSGLNADNLATKVVKARYLFFHGVVQEKEKEKKRTERTENCSPRFAWL